MMEKKKGLDYAERAKQDTFDAILSNIKPLMDEKQYDEARHMIRKELGLLAGAMGGDEYNQLKGLEREFEDLLPERTSRLLNPEGPEARARAQSEKVAKINRLLEEKPKESKEGGAKALDVKSSGRDKWPRGRTWPVPEFDEVRPGLILETENIENHFKDRLEIIGTPYQPDKDGDFLVKVRDTASGVEYHISLQDRGIYPHYDSDGDERWSLANRPVRWYQKGEKPTEG